MNGIQYLERGILLGTQRTPGGIDNELEELRDDVPLLLNNRRRRNSLGVLFVSTREDRQGNIRRPVRAGGSFLPVPECSRKSYSQSSKKKSP